VPRQGGEGAAVKHNSWRRRGGGVGLMRKWMKREGCRGEWGRARGRWNDDMGRQHRIGRHGLVRIRGGRGAGN
jgi:hypothetical protein